MYSNKTNSMNKWLKRLICMKVLSVIALVTFGSFLYTQAQQNMDTVTVMDAVQNQRIQDMSRRIDVIDTQMDRLNESLRELTNSMNRIIGLGAGVSFVLAGMHAIQIVYQVKRPVKGP